VIVNNTNFEVLYETDNFIVVNKPAPLLVHPSVPGNPPTLLDGVKGLLAYDIANGAKLSIINRLDRETSGVVIVAKNKPTARQFGIAMQEHKITKEYLAVVHGTPEEKKFTVEAPILRAGEVEESKIWVKQIIHPNGKSSITRFELIEKLKNFSLLKAIPETGRMHQIRVHSLHVNLPIVGDKIYGLNENLYLEFIKTGWTKELESELIMPRQALHCHRMSLEGVGEWEAPMPNSFKTCGAAS